MKLHIVTFILLVIGGLNWLAVGLLQIDLVSWLFGGVDMLASRVVYVLVGVSAVYEILTHKSNCRTCGTTSAM